MEVSREVPAKTGAGNTVETAHTGSHDAHGYDPSNPHYFGLPLGVIIAAAISAAAVGITLLKFFYFH